MATNTISPIIRDVFTNKEDALFRARELGCTSYREYNIDGTIVYVPCGTYLDYEKALRLKIVQGKTDAVTGKDDVFGSNLVGLQFANTQIGSGDPFLTLGNFSIDKSVTILNPTTPNTQENTVGYTAKSITDTVNVSGDNLTELIKSKVNSGLLPTFNYDKANVDRFVLFSSLKEKIKNGIIEITRGFPAAIRVEDRGNKYENVTEYIQNVKNNTSNITIDTDFFRNPFNIEYSTIGSTLADYEDVDPIRNFTKYYDKYCVFYNDVEYRIINLIQVNGSFTIVVEGLPFNDIMVANKANALFHIKPNISECNRFFNNISDISKFILNYDVSTNIYKTIINVPEFDNDGNYILVPNVLIFPTIDNVNIDLFSNNFDIYITTLNDISDSFDNYKTNLISRFLTTDSLKEFDTEDRKFEAILQLYGRSFDAVRVYVDSLSYMRNVSYDKIDNIPDLLLKNYASMLGWDTAKLEDDNSLIENLFKTNQPLSNTITPEEFDIEIWRRLLINTAYLFKSKGTRSSISMLLSIVGIPDYIIDINEYVYLAEQKLDTVAKYNQIAESLGVEDATELIGKYPFDEEGYPKLPLDKVFQENGGYVTVDNDNIGPYDNGKSYIDAYRTFAGTVNGFDLIRVEDNIKVNSNVDERLVINTKEVDIYLSSERVLDYAVYRYFKRNNKNIVNEFYSPTKETIVIQNLSFSQFINNVLNSFIGVRNRKTSITYPTLTKMFYDYSKATGSPITDSGALGFLNQFDTYWVNLVKQFIPATTIFNTGKRIKNSLLMDNKFVYKGVDDGALLSNTALRRPNTGQATFTVITSPINTTIGDNIKPFGVNSKLNLSILGIDRSVNLYTAKYYTSKDDYGRNGNFYHYDSTIDYTSNTYNGNINTRVNASGLTVNDEGGRYGVFVIYDNKVYRLKTINQYNNSLSQLTPTGSTIGPTNFILGGVSQNKPNNSYTVYSFYNGLPNIVTNGLSSFDFIPTNTDSTTITFADCPNPTYAERQYFIDSISRALAYIEIGFTFDSPPPKPHTCYFDLTGRTIDLEVSGNSGQALYVPPTNAYYIDNTNSSRVIKQPLYYGYSKYNASGKPSDGIYANGGNWVVPYIQYKDWTNNVLYYKDDIVRYSNVNYLITSTTALGTLATPTGSTSTSYVNGMYETYSKREVTDPLMHIEPAYISKLNLDPQNDTYSFNLSKLISSYSVFSGNTIDTTYKVDDIFIGGQLFMDKSLDVTFDGLYPIDEDKVGPFYILDDDKILINTLIDSVTLLTGRDNYISIESINERFDKINDKTTFVKSDIGYYLVKEKGYYKFDFGLFFESESAKGNTQKVLIKLVNQQGNRYNEQSFTFSGGDDASDRVYNYVYEGFFNSNDRVYLTIEPLLVGCKLSRYEKIEYNYNEFGLGEYNPLNDGRFRLMFNGGRLINANSQFENVLSIQPLFGKSDSGTSGIVKTDNYLLSPQGQPSKYVSLVKQKLLSNNDPTLIFNKLYGQYYDKFRDEITQIDNDSLVYDKDINYDKLNFSFNVRTRRKPTPSDGRSIAIGNSESVNTTNTTVGDYGLTVLKKIDMVDYYLGNTMPVFDDASPSFNITLGKQQIKRSNVVTKTLTYAPNRSYVNGNTLVDSTTTASYTIKGSDIGLSDYELLDYNNSFIDEYQTKNYNTTGGTYLYENPIYNSDVYLSLLDNCELFDASIINYQINDVVKFTTENYNRVVRNNEGVVIVTEAVTRLYVCVEEITSKHCNKVNNQLTSIKDIYHPSAGNSCFVEIVDYDPKFFTPWGYEKWTNRFTTYTNVNPYTNNSYLSYTGATSTFFNLTLGDIVNYNNKIFRYNYNKPITFNVTDNGMVYYKGDVVQYLSGSTYNFYLCNSLTGTTSNPLSGDWSLVNPFTPGITQSGVTNGVPITVLKTRRLPNLLPSDAGWSITTGITTGLTSDINDVYKYEVLNLPHGVGGDIGSINFPHRISNYTGSTFDPNISYTTSTNDYYYSQTALDITDVLFGASIYDRQPVFEELCPIYMINNPKDYATGQTYNAYEIATSYKYAVSHGKLWRFKGDNATGITANNSTVPYLNPTLWDDRDFCVAESFVFYKDRVKAKVYCSNVVSLTDEVKDSLYFYDSNLDLKSSFTTTSFSGSTLDNRLLNALQKYEEAKDVNIKSVSKFGDFSTRVSNKDMILDYLVDKDISGLPRTGEFIGKLSLKDICGNVSTTIFGLLLDTDVSKIADLGVKYVDTLVNTGNVTLAPYYVRTIVSYSLQESMTMLFTGITTGVLQANSNTSIDRNIPVQPNGDLTIVFKYPIGKNKTRIKSIKVNNVDISLLPSDKISVVTSIDGTIETKVIVLKNNVTNSVLVFDSEISSSLGLNNLDLNTTIKITEN